jgi:LAO/AO transport system kinase
MEGLSHRANAFVRPSPTSGTLGGVARKTREAMLLCEAAGFDVVLVETVGVGQSEATVAEMVDLFVLLLLPGGGDELQGIKRGILERADLIVINKADGPLKPVAERTRRDYAAALHTLPGTRSGRQVMTVSATEGHGVEDIWTAVGAMRDERLASGDWQRQRDAQRLRWLWSAIEDGIHDALHRDPALREAVERAERDVSSGRVAPTRAADAVLARLLGRAPG